MENAQKKPLNHLIKQFFPLCSATGSRTRVYGVRGRCPRPLDESTLLLFLSKAGAKVLLFFHIRKFLMKKMRKKCKILAFCLYISKKNSNFATYF